MTLFRSLFVGFSALTLSLFSSPTIETAKAVSFDFSAYATGTGEHGAPSETVTMGGVAVTVTGYDLVTNTSYLAYFDGPLITGEPGGLGVCKGLFFPGGECSEPPDDDDFGMNEVLKLVFNQPVTITDILFRTGDHDLNFLGNFGVLIDAAPVNAASFTQYLTTPTFAGPLFGTTFYFVSSSTFTGNNAGGHRLYISGFDASPVPEPMTLTLVGAGLLGALRRRRG